MQKIAPKLHKLSRYKNTRAKYFWKVSKNCSNEIRTIEIRIRQEPSVFLIEKKNISKKSR